MATPRSRCPRVRRNFDQADLRDVMGGLVRTRSMSGEMAGGQPQVSSAARMCVPKRPNYRSSSRRRPILCCDDSLCSGSARSRTASMGGRTSSCQPSGASLMKHASTTPRGWPFASTARRRRTRAQAQPSDAAIVPGGGVQPARQLRRRLGRRRIESSGWPKAVDSRVEHVTATQRRSCSDSVSSLAGA